MLFHGVNLVGQKWSVKINWTLIVYLGSCQWSHAMPATAVEWNMGTMLAIALKQPTGLRKKPLEQFINVTSITDIICQQPQIRHYWLNVRHVLLALSRPVFGNCDPDLSVCSTKHWVNWLQCAEWPDCGLWSELITERGDNRVIRVGGATWQPCVPLLVNWL